MFTRTSLIRLAVALLGIVAIAVAATNMHERIEYGPPGANGDTAPVFGSVPTTEPDGTVVAIEGLQYVLAALVILAAIGCAWYLIVHRRELVRALAFGALILTMFVILAALLSYVGITPTLQEPVGDFDQQPVDQGEGGSGSTIPMGPLVGVLVLVTMIFFAMLALHNEEDVGERVRGTLKSSSWDSSAAVRAIGASAGQTADSIERSGDLENEIFRAWRDMTRLLDVDHPERTTPREFESAAIDSGMNPTHITELTRLFEAVRYGEIEPTAERESRAITVCRRIERSYADGESTTSSDATEKCDASTTESRSSDLEQPGVKSKTSNSAPQSDRTNSTTETDNPPEEYRP